MLSSLIRHYRHESKRHQNNKEKLHHAIKANSMLQEYVVSLVLDELLTRVLGRSKCFGMRIWRSKCPYLALGHIPPRCNPTKVIVATQRQNGNGLASEWLRAPATTHHSLPVCCSPRASSTMSFRSIPTPVQPPRLTLPSDRPPPAIVDAVTSTTHARVRDQHAPDAHPSTAHFR